jgi:regulator of protease activity HflC (stomatin/prohibitin superfamily)
LKSSPARPIEWRAVALALNERPETQAAEAQSRTEQIRGDGDAERNRIFAEAYGKDPDFFAFYRSTRP